MSRTSIFLIMCIAINTAFAALYTTKDWIIIAYVIVNTLIAARLAYRAKEVK